MKWPFRRTGIQPRWDPQLAERLGGATVLVGITYDEPAGARLEQFFGTVMEAHPTDGVSLRLEGSRLGEVYTLPPDLRAFKLAPEGSYRLRETGEIVLNPDFTTTWTITPPIH